MEPALTNKKWHVVYTKPRNEKKVAERLKEEGKEVYCPVQTTIRQWSDRKKKVQIPIFPSYVFLRIGENERESILQVPGIVRFVFWLGKPAIARDEEISTLKSFLSEHEHSEINIDFEKGNAVTIAEGLFKNESGIYMGSKQGKAVIVLASIGLKVLAKKQHLKIESK